MTMTIRQHISTVTLTMGIPDRAMLVSMTAPFSSKPPSRTVTAEQDLRGIDNDKREVYQRSFSLPDNTERWETAKPPPRTCETCSLVPFAMIY